jgi:hypothetical protein
MAVGETLYIVNGSNVQAGNYTVVSINSSVSVTVKWLNYPSDAVATTTITSGGLVTPTGVRGATGATGATGPSGGGGGSSFRVLGTFQCPGNGTISLEAGSTNIASVALVADPNGFLTELLILVTFTTALSSALYPVFSSLYTSYNRYGAGFSFPYTNGVNDGRTTTTVLLILENPTFGSVHDPSTTACTVVLMIP